MGNSIAVEDKRKEEEEEEKQKKNGILVTNLINAVLDVIGATKETAERGGVWGEREREDIERGEEVMGSLARTRRVGDEDDEATIIAIGADR